MAVEREDEERGTKAEWRRGCAGDRRSRK